MFTPTFILRTIYEVNGTARYFEIFWPATDNNERLALLFQHKEDNFLKLTIKNRSQQIRSEKMVNQLSSGMIGGDCHLRPTRKNGYLQIFSARLGTAVTWRGQGAESGGEVVYYHDGWQVCHYDETARGGWSAEIDGERTVGHDINADREGLASCSVCTFLAPFIMYSIPNKLFISSKLTTLAMYSMFFFADHSLHLQAVFIVAGKMPLWTYGRITKTHHR